MMKELKIDGNKPAFESTRIDGIQISTGIPIRLYIATKLLAGSIDELGLPNMDIESALTLADELVSQHNTDLDVV